MPRRTDEQFWGAELHRIEGELRQAAGHAAAEVEQGLITALEISRRQGTKMFELRAIACRTREQPTSLEASDRVRRMQRQHRRHGVVSCGTYKFFAIATPFGLKRVPPFPQFTPFAVKEEVA